MIRSLLAVLALTLGLAGTAQADTDQPGTEPVGTGLSVEAPWARAAPGGMAMAAGFMILTNAGDADDRLLRAETSAAGRTELHESRHDADGMMRMRPVEAITVPAGGSATLAPGGLHVMFMDLPAPLVPGSDLELTLHFERAGAVTVTVPVRAITEGPPAAGHGKADPHAAH